MINPELCGGQFSGDSWSTWRVLLAGFYGLPFGQAGARRITALPGPAQVLLLEFGWPLAVGGGKLQITALAAVRLAEFRDCVHPGFW